MGTYRVYRIGPDEHVRLGLWLEAKSDQEAVNLARDLCDERSPKVEVWQESRRIGVVPCDEQVDTG